MRFSYSKRCKLWACALVTISLPLTSAEAQVFRAGAVATDISPKTFPRIIAGGFLEKIADRATTSLYSRAIVLDDGKTKIAFVIVDTCMMEQRLIDEAKALASKECGIPTDRMMISATHTHSAPAAMSCLGTRKDVEYAKFLVPKIAESIVEAHKKLQPAKIGWGSIDDWEHTHNRRWIRLAGKEVVDPFGEPTGRANMHPGYLSKDVVGPSGPVDPQLSVISIQTSAGQPLAVLANYSQHYFGQSPSSADYFGLFCKSLAARMNQPGDGNGPFLAAMSQGTSGDLMWMDYGAEKKNITIEQYADEVASYAFKALQSIKHHAHVPLGMVEKVLPLKYRVPDEKRLAWARPIAAKIENDIPKNKEEVYAREALILHERQKTSLKLQAIRIGDLGITTLPNEVFAITGLKLKAASSSSLHFNIELANGAEGYIPPPEQHTLGGYTTWPARTAGLEVEAEPKIVKTLIKAHHEASGGPNQGAYIAVSDYMKALSATKPVGIWRLDEADGAVASNSRLGGEDARIVGGAAWYLPGVGSGEGYGAEQLLKRSAFSSGSFNRSLHLAGGYMEASLPRLQDKATVALWFWLGHESGASDRFGTLIEAFGTSLNAHQFADHTVQLEWSASSSARPDGQPVPAGQKTVRPAFAGDWHLVALVRDGTQLRVYLDGSEKPVLEGTATAIVHKLTFGKGLQGKLDEIALWDRAVEPSLIASLWETSKIGEENARRAEQRAKKAAERERLAREAAEKARPPQISQQYRDAIRNLKPMIHWPLDKPADGGGKLLEGSLTISPATFAHFSGGRIRAAMPKLGGKYSAAFWFRNDSANEASPVTAYLFSHGRLGDAQAPGDHLGISGNHRGEPAGRLMFFNGNASNQLATGHSLIAPGTWNHVVLVRDGARMRAWLNGGAKAELDAEIAVTGGGAADFCIGARSDMFAPLNGYIAGFALLDRALGEEEARKLGRAAAIEASGSGTSGQGAALPTPPSATTSKPLSPEESQKKIHIREGFKVELIASEPVVLDPVAFDWDEKGRLWVVEMADYPLGMDGNGKVGGRVVILDDTNSDGRYDKRTVFAEGLSFPTGILTWRDGAIVTAAPDILFLQDSNGDGRADERRVLFTGFSTGNQQLRVNGLRWGMDGWVYCAGGAHTVNYNKSTLVEGKLTGEKIDLGSRDFRFRPDTGEFDPQTGPSQFGRCRDDWDHWFGVQNSKPLWHYVLQDHYLRRNPHVIPPDPIAQLYPLNPPVFPASEPEKRYHSFNQAGRYTSACGINVYRGGMLFDDGKIHAFTCEPFHNLVQHHVLEEDGVTFKSKIDTDGKTPDFFASEDRWCRPVMVRDGPDGAIYIADMYRYMIEHPQWLPQNGKDELLPHYREGDDKGRIWRVSRATVPASGVQASGTAPSKAAASAQLLSSPSGWLRDKAQMLIAQQKPNDMDGALIALACDGPTAQSRAQAAWTLQLLGKMTPQIYERLLIDPSPRVREQGMIIAEQNESPLLIAAASKLAQDKDEKVRLQLASSLGAMKGEWAAALLADLLKAAPPSSALHGAAMSSVLPHLQRVCELADGKSFAMLFRCALATKNDHAAAALVTRVKEPESLRELLAVLDERGLSLAEFAKQAQTPAAKEAIGVLVAKLTKTAESVKSATSTSSLSDLALLASDREHREIVRKLLPELWAKTGSPEVLALARRLQPADGPGFLLAGWGSRTPAERGQIIEALLSSDGWTLALLQRPEAAACDATTRARLLQHPKKQIKELAAKAFAGQASASRTAVLARFKPALALDGDRARGKATFTAAGCIACHQLDGVGLPLGPDLRSVVQHDAEKLLNSILDPSAVIEPGFAAYHCSLKSGEQLYGIVTTETSSSLTVKLPGNLTRSVLRSDIKELKATQTSLMPDGLEALLTPQSLADLITYLQTPK